METKDIIGFPTHPEMAMVFRHISLLVMTKTSVRSDVEIDEPASTFLLQFGNKDYHS